MLLKLLNIALSAIASNHRQTRLFCSLPLLVSLLLLNACSIFSGQTVTNGLYWSEEYGEYLQIENGQFSRLQWDPINCANGAAGLIPAVGHIPKILGQFKLHSAANDNLVLQRLSDRTFVQFNAIKQLPHNCIHPPVHNNLHQLLSMRFNLARFDARVDNDNYQRLQNNVQELDTLIADESEIELLLFDQLVALLASLRDRHAFLYARALSKYQGFFSPRSAEPIVTQLEAGQTKKFCNDEIELKQLDKGVWYIKIYQLVGFSNNDGYSIEAEQCITDLVRYFNRSQITNDYQLVIDLANNGGGSIQLAASIFAAVTGYTGLPFAFIGAQVVTADPSIGLQYPPKYGLVLVNQATASAAEHLALALQHSGFKIAGTTTMGAFSPTMIKTLPNGWFYGFSMYRHIRDQHGQPVPEHTGLTPDCPDPLTDIIQLISTCR